MNLYAVVLNSPNKEVMETAKQVWGSQAYVLTDHVVFLAPDNTVLTDEISEALHIGRDIPGVVVEVSHYSGFNRNSLWEWMEKFA